MCIACEWMEMQASGELTLLDRLRIRQAEAAEAALAEEEAAEEEAGAAPNEATE